MRQDKRRGDVEIPDSDNYVKTHTIEWLSIQYCMGWNSIFSALYQSSDSCCETEQIFPAMHLSFQHSGEAYPIAYTWASKRLQ